MKKIIALFTLFCAIGIATAADDFGVLCLGDSITACKWSYVSLIDGTDSFKAFNAGAGGRCAIEGGKLLEMFMGHHKKDHIDHVLMFMGVNDLKIRHNPPGDPDKRIAGCVKGMSEAIDVALKRFKPEQITLMAPCDVNPDIMSGRVRQEGYRHCGPLLARLETEYKALAKKKAVHFLSLLNVVSKENYGDGLHPNEEGQAEIANAIIPHLKKLQDEEQ